jgi:hypothetical protein
MLSIGFKPCVCILAAASALAQTPSSAASLAFDVASVRPNKPGSSQHTNVPLDSGDVYATVSLDDARTAGGGCLSPPTKPSGATLRSLTSFPARRSLPSVSISSPVHLNPARPFGSPAPSTPHRSSSTSRRVILVAPHAIDRLCLLVPRCEISPVRSRTLLRHGELRLADACPRSG